MATIDLACKTCGHTFAVVTRAAVKDSQKRLPGLQVRRRTADLRQLPAQRRVV